MDAPAIPPNGPATLDATILICTYNRAADLASTLDSIATMRVPKTLTWDVLVMDNNSSDDTRTVVAQAARRYPVPLRYLFESAQGKSNALNTGINATSARIIVFTDDDVQVPEGWLEAAARPLMTRDDIDYTGGPVRPIWRGARPGWLDERGNFGGTIAVMDHGAEPFIFEERRKTALGVNMAVRRSLIERIGGFRPDLGRSGNSLLGQEQAEFFYRSRRAGAKGVYVPAMVLDHVVAASRLTRTYFRRWWYWKGVSHARLHRIHGMTELGLDLNRAPRIAGVPRFLFGNAFRDALGAVRCFVARDQARCAQHAWMLAYFGGYWRESRRSHAPVLSPSDASQRPRSAAI